MKKTFITAFLLLSVLICSTPAVWGMPNPSPLPRQAAAAHDHSCCPGFHPKSIVPLVVPASIPCSKQHPCCAKQRPANPALLPATLKITPQSFHSQTAVMAETSSARQANPEVCAQNLLLDQLRLRTTILRI